MGGQTTTTQNTSQQSQTQPWLAAQPQLQGLLGKLGGVDTGVTPQQSAAAGALTTAAGNLPSFAPQITSTADRKSTRLNSSHRSLSRMPSSA